MSSLDAKFMDQYVLRIAAMTYLSGIIGTLAVGIQLCMFTYGLLAYLKTPQGVRKGRLPYIILSFVLLVLPLAVTCLDLRDEFRPIYQGELGMEYYQEKMLEERTWSPVVCQGLFYLILALGDGILVYRCWIIWNDFLPAVVLPVILYLGFILGLALAQFTHYARGTIWNSDADRLRDRQINVARVSLSVALNVLATSMIVYRIVVAQRALSQALPGRKLGVYTTAARIVIESALPLSICGLLFAVLSPLTWAALSGDGRPNLLLLTAGIFFDIMYSTLAALSPQMIIFRVTMGRSHIHSGDLGSSINSDDEQWDDVEIDSDPKDNLSAVEEPVHYEALNRLEWDLGLGDAHRESRDGIWETSRVGEGEFVVGHSSGLHHEGSA
ncbi:hypothetical protein CC2G_004375 [Coprinopsis cinerea AmutBmut pab1-1]|nr:hypothetical protein CC2G_004375 [Coprinopsis cinerea AmutBmut pab1-1]